MSMHRKLPVALSAIAISIAFTILLSVTSIEFFSQYGWNLFLFTPFICGSICSIIYNRKGDRKFGETVSVSFLAGCLSLLTFLLMGLEGVICLVMAAPIMLPCFLLGGVVGYKLSHLSAFRSGGPASLILILVLSPVMMGFEAAFSPESELREVSTRVNINGTAEDVWREVIAFSEIPPPTEFLFRTGIAYPVSARIEGEGVGAVRHCNFSTGPFIEPITHWEEPRRLAFDVVSQPEPMVEISPYAGIHPPHLDWAVQSERGEFLIETSGDGEIILRGTTWYRIRMAPEPYWSWISDRIIEKIHLRVLHHIRDEVQKTN